MKPRILMVISAYYPVIGGAERQAQKLSEILVDRGYSVTVLTTKYNGLKSYEEIGGVKVFRRGVFRHKLRQYSFFYNVYMFISKNHEKYDVVHVHQGLVPAAIASLAAKRKGMPSLVKIGNSGYKFDLKLIINNYWLGKLFYRWVVDNASVFIAISDSIKLELENLPIAKDQVRQIPNGVYFPEQFNKNFYRNSLGYSTSEVIGICVARLNEAKNHEFLLKIFSKIKSNNFRVLLLGDGSLRSRIETAVHEYGLEGRLEVLGNVDNIYEYMKMADFFILPSKTEGLSNALLESMAHRLVPIVSDIPGNRMVLHGRSNDGLLLPLDNINAWVAATEKVIGDKNFREQLSFKASEVIKSRYQLDYVVSQYEELYAYLLKNKQ